MEDFMQPLKHSYQIEKAFLGKYWGYFLIDNSPILRYSQNSEKQKIETFFIPHSSAESILTRGMLKGLKMYVQT